MTQSEDATRDVEESGLTTHLEGTRRGEDIAELEGNDPAHIELEGTGADRPAGGRTAADPNRIGQDREGMTKRGTVDPDASDPSGGPNM